MTELPELLGQLEDEWGRRGVPLGQLRPGVSRDEVETKVRALPLDLDPPEELYEWYAWHDGSTWQDCDTARANGGFIGEMPLLPGRDEILSLDRACEQTAMWVDIFDSDEIVPDQGQSSFAEWSARHHPVDYVASHFHLLGNNPYTYISLACVGGDTGRVYRREVRDISDAEPLDSIADLVCGLLTVYERGEVEARNSACLEDGSLQQSDFETMDSSRVAKRDPLIARFS